MSKQNYIKTSMPMFWLMVLFGLGLGIGSLLGLFGTVYIMQIQMQSYDLYNCIYNNAASNTFNQNPIMIEKIQNECVCFREHDYQNLLEADC